ncbi:DUF2075 domain-containing protein [Levilactobacillus parabrevis]|uniref:DUF2075 domain-containing protein n=1 Tax=Levilactobacillus parabrevis TaxID=357278 RepID=UPI0021A6B197|nr:DUF2075 domain-containing protein [Levilactobacillus parabrevis]MCT4486781.1 DUF2075 domain-containing protein [Levilactobacillus parabrevis]MCT4491157.1 DUF2075 domain-containing protein [Levilactobacillus parabrevis]
MAKLPQPVVLKVDFSKDGLVAIRKKSQGNQAELLLEFPTVYLVYDETKPATYDVYVGETNNIEQRTQQHLLDDVHRRQDWKYLADSRSSKLLVIGHEHFNKSLTLDIENKMMLYMSGVTSVKRLNNRRENQQNKYYTADERDAIFSKIWRKLNQFDQKLFPVESIIQDSALFKASPFHALTTEQEHARELILRRIEAVLRSNKGHQLILVEGEAGSGKTVLLSTLFYQLWQLGQDKNYSDFSVSQNYLLVNHDEQVKVYENISRKLGMDTTHVSKPTRFINQHSADVPADIVLVDEAHLLWTQGKQSYRGKNQLKDIMDRAKLTVAVFDPKQILKTEEYLTSNEVKALEAKVGQQGNLIKFKAQMRMNASEATTTWLRELIDRRVVSKIPMDDSYDLRIFDDPMEMYEAIKRKASDEQSGLSRLLATFDWPYKSGSQEVDYVTVGDLSLPWNLQLPLAPEQRGQGKKLAWAEQNQTIGEVGSTYTIQGFDLNYSGVIIGPSVKYRDGKVVYDPKLSSNKRATERRTLSSGEKSFVYEDLLPNELNVLLTRGVNGLYIYAVDDELRTALLAAAGK